MASVGTRMTEEKKRSICYMARALAKAYAEHPKSNGDYHWQNRAVALALMSGMTSSEQWFFENAVHDYADNTAGEMFDS